MQDYLLPSPQMGTREPGFCNLTKQLVNSFQQAGDLLLWQRNNFSLLFSVLIN